MKQSLRAWLIDALAIVAGSALLAAGLVLFTIPNDIAPGGVSGLATALAHITPVRVGLWSLLLNLPIIALAWWKLGFLPIVKSIAATILYALFIDLFSPLLPAYSNNPLLAAVLGGVLTGAGMGVIFVRGASTGGTDLVSLMLGRVFPGFSIGTLLLFVDALVVIFAVCVFRDIEVALYSIVTIFAATKTIDAIMQGVDHAKVLYVVTERGGEVLALLAGELGRGVTVIEAQGGYTRRSKQMLTLVMRRSDFSATLKAVKRADPAAFLFVTNASEVHGEGFKPLE
ncbi:MAG: YitT family protein [Clostridia bacterium]|nr:YitT family protein [Clostridia bacterium]